MEDADELLVNDRRPFHQVQGFPSPQVLSQVFVMFVQNRWISERRIKQRVPEEASFIFLINSDSRGIARQA